MVHPEPGSRPARGGPRRWPGGERTAGSAPKDPDPSAALPRPYPALESAVTRLRCEPYGTECGGPGGSPPRGADGARNQSGGRLEIGGVGEDKCPSFPFTLDPAERASPAAVPTVETVITF